MAETNPPNERKRGREETRRVEPAVPRRDAVEDRREAGPERRVGSLFDHYAPLVSPSSQILMTIEEHPMRRWPKTYSEVPKKSHSLGSFCRLHNDYGHTTDECEHFWDEVERLIRTKNLKEFVKLARAFGRPPPRTEPQSGLPAPRIEGGGRSPWTQGGVTSKEELHKHDS